MPLAAALRAGFALAVVLGTATVASAGSSGFGAATVRIGPNGLEPASLRIAAYRVFIWENRDSIAHTLEFANGRCSLTPDDLGAGQQHRAGHSGAPRVAAPAVGQQPSA